MVSIRIFIWIFLLIVFYCRSSAQIFEIKQGDKWGFIDGKGKVLIPAKYDFIYDDYEYSRQDEGYFVFLQGDSMGVYQVGVGELIAPLYQTVRVFSNLRHDGYIEIKQGGKYGALDTLGKPLIEPFCDELRQVLPQIFAYRQGEFWGAMSLDSSIQIKPEYDELHTELGHYIIGVRRDFYSAWRKDGNRIFSNKETPMNFLSEHLLTYQATDTSLVGLADSSGTPFTEAIYDTFNVDDGYFKIHRGPDEGLVSTRGKIYLEAAYANISVDSTRRIWYQDSTGFWGILDREGNMIAPNMFRLRGSFAGNLAMVPQGSGWGVINQFGDMLTDSSYDQIRFEDGAILLNRSGIWTQIPVDEEGRREIRRKLIVKAKKESVEADSLAVDSTGGRVIRPETVGWFRHRGRWGWRDTTTHKVKIEPVFSDVVVIPNREVSLILHDISGPKRRLVGLANHRTGKIITQPELNMIYIQDFEHDPVARAQYSTGAFVLVSISGKVKMLARTAYLGSFSEGIARGKEGGEYARLVKNVGDEPALPGRGGKWGFITNSGRWGVKPVYDAAVDFSYGIGPLKFKGKWGAVDTSFATIIPPKYDTLFVAGSKDTGINQPTPLINTMIRHRKYFYLDEKGNLLFSYQFDDSGDFFEGMARVRKDHKWGYLDTAGNLAIPIKFERAGDFHEGVACVRKNLRWGFVNTDGSFSIEPQYMDAGNFVEGIALVKEGARYGYIRSDGKWQIKPVYRKAGDFYHGRAIARRKNGYGVIDTRGNWVISSRFGRIYRDGNYFKVKQKSLYGFYDAKGTELVAPECSYVGEFSDGRARIRIGREYGYIDTSRVMVLPTKYSMARDFQGSLAAVKYEGLWGVVDQAGEFVVPAIHRGIQILSGGEIKVLNDKKFWQPLGTLSQETVRKVWSEKDSAKVHHEIFEWVRGRFGYDQIHSPRERIIVASCEKLYGLASLSGEILFEPRFEKIRLRSNLYKVVEDGNIGYLDQQGNWVFAIEGIMRGK